MKRLTLDESDIDCLETLAGYNEGVAMFTALLPALEAEPSCRLRGASPSSRTRDIK